MKKTLLLMVIAAASLSLVSCSADEPELIVTPETQEEKAPEEDNGITVIVDPTETVVEENIGV